MTMVALAPMDLAALLCSRVCHDVISPVGAIVNGLEVLEDEKDPEMREVAIELIKKSAASASARLQFCRLAFGAAGSMGAAIDTGDAEIGDARVDRPRRHDAGVEPAAPVRRQKQGQAAAQPVPDRAIDHSARRRHCRRLQRPGRSLALRVEAKGANAGSPRGVADLVAGQPESGAVDAHSIQPYFTGLVARECGMEVAITVEPESVTLEARPTGVKA